MKGSFKTVAAKLRAKWHPLFGFLVTLTGVEIFSDMVIFLLQNARSKVTRNFFQRTLIFSPPIPVVRWRASRSPFNKVKFHFRRSVTRSNTGKMSIVKWKGNFQFLVRFALWDRNTSRSFYQTRRKPRQAVKVHKNISKTLCTPLSVFAVKNVRW